jgi:hypothetical protein
MQSGRLSSLLGHYERMKSLLTSMFRPIGVALVAIGLNPRLMSNVRFAWRYFRTRYEWRRCGGVITASAPILSDFISEAGIARGHYFHQDLLVASAVHEANPLRHIDIGSRIDGLVAHIASFRAIEVLDIRDLPPSNHPNITFLKADLMDPTSGQQDIADSLSCLHAIEHFGLGRYGDPIDPQGHIKGFRNICRMIRIGGRLYISFPVARKRGVVFNAHRIFEPKDILNWFESERSFSLVNFNFVNDDGALLRDITLDDPRLDADYGCGIYTFVREK